MAKKTGDGAKGINYKDICPICGKPRTEDCMNSNALEVCPNDKECGNNEKGVYNGKDKYLRIGCTGYLCGNVGIGTFLGSNIMIHTYKDKKPKPRSPSDDARKDSLNNYMNKIKASNKEIVAAFAKKNVAQEVIDDHQKDFAEELDKFEILKNKLYKYKGHPLYVSGGGIQAHHIICTEAMKDAKWRAICKDTGYNINCWRNGIFLPSFANLACHRGYPRHFGRHSLGRGEQKGDGSYKSYVDSVKKEINGVSDSYNRKVCNANTTEKFINEINQISKDVCVYIQKFDWTITWDGLNYNKDVEPYIGCSGLTGLDSTEKKKEKLIKKLKVELEAKKLIYESKRGKSKGEMKWRTSNNDMETINNLDSIDAVCCKSNHDEDFTNEEKKNFDDFKFEVGH